MENNTEINLLEELQRATEIKNSPMEPLQAPQGNETDQPGEHPPTDQPGENKEQFSDDFLPPTDIPTPGEALTSLTYSADKTADLIIEGVDTLFEHAFPALYTNSFSKDDRRGLKALAAKYRQTKKSDTMTLDGEDQRLMEIYCDYEKYVESCPLDEDEKNSLKAPLVEVLKKQNYQTTPETALMISASIVTLPRLIPVLINLKNASH